jgi:hypothetical protein
MHSIVNSLGNSPVCVIYTSKIAVDVDDVAVVDWGWGQHEADLPIELRNAWQGILASQSRTNIRYAT